MSSIGEPSDKKTVPMFQPFTQESLAAIGTRTADEAARKAEQDHLNGEGAIGLDRVPKQWITHHIERSEPNPSLKVGNHLPRKLARNFPRELVAVPIEDLDKYYENEKTFMIISKGKNIFRFSANNSMFVLSPFNCLRRFAIYTLVHPAFSFFIMATLFINCVFMTVPYNETIETSEKIFTIIYTVESCIKVIAMGFILEKFTYLRDPWNWLDFILNASAYVTMYGDFGHWSALRTFRVLKALQMAFAFKGFKLIVGAVIESIKNLRYVIILTLYSLLVFAILGLQLYMGVLTQKCVRNPDPTLDISWDDYVSNYSMTDENWLKEGDEYILCGNSSGARRCPEDSTCVQGVGLNPDYGYTTFDTFPWALLSAFRLMTRDYWESLCQMVLRTSGPWHMLLFAVIIFWCSFYLLYSILAVVAMTYKDFLRKSLDEEVEEPLEKCIDSSRSQNCLSKNQSDSSLPDLTIQRVTNIKERGDEEKSLKERCLANCLKCIDIFCVWDCCVCWVRFQEIASSIVFDPFMYLFSTLCVVMDILFMAMDHHNMDSGFDEFLRYGNYFFTAFYTMEAGLRLITLSPKHYFHVGWNKFDFIIVVLSLLDLALEGVQGLSILRAFRLLRVFKLVKSWPTMNLILNIMNRLTKHELGKLTFVLGIIIFFFAVMGMHLFGKYYEEKKHMFPNGEVPRYNFKDFMHSFMTVFRALCGEWIETMWDCMLVGGWGCIPFFLSFVVIGNLLVLNLIFASLLFSFGVICVGALYTDTEDSKKLKEAMGRFCRARKWLRNSLLHILKVTRAAVSATSETSTGVNSPIPMSQRGPVTNRRANETLEMMREELPETLTTTFKGDSQVSGGKLDSDKYSNNTETILYVEESPADCCPDCCYILFPFCRRGESQFWIKWENARKKSFYVIEHEYSQRVVFTAILISSLALAAEDIHLKDRPLLKEILQYVDKVFTVFFLFEMLTKWMAFGFKNYFTNRWCRVDFVVLFIAMFNLVVELIGYANTPVVKAIRTLRALYPLRITSRLQGTRVLVNMLVAAIPTIFNVILVCFTFWLFFAILGVQMMGGKFFACTDIDKNWINASFVPDKYDCLSMNFTWINQQINFDNVLNAYLALFQVATIKGWIQIINDGMDSTGIDQQPEAEYSIYMYLYFVYFVIFGSFFTVSLLTVIIIHFYKEQNRKIRGSVEMFMTDGQIKYYKSMKKMVSKKPVKAIPRPESKLQAIVFGLITNKKFDMAIMIFICLNMTVMAMEHNDPTPLYSTILESFNIFFIAIFTAECVLKIFALRMHYFKKPWNVFDFAVVTLSILEVILKDLIAKYYFISSTLLRICSIAKVGRVLRLLKYLLLSKGIKTLWFALIMSLPDLFNICQLLFLVMFIYAIFGMSFFMNVRHRAYVDQKFNFETFGQSMILLFQMFTLAGWDAVLPAIMEEDDCNKDGEEGGDCGSRNIAVAYLVSYLIISILIITMYIVVILESYNQTMEDLTEDDYDMYYEIWQQFDPDGTQFIKYSDLATFLDSLEEPLQIPSPNKYKIISMDIPIYEGDLLHCVDIFDALIKDFFQRKGYHIDKSPELEIRESRTTTIGSTLDRQREAYAAHVIQLAWRRYKN